MTPRFARFIWGAFFGTLAGLFILSCTVDVAHYETDLFADVIHLNDGENTISVEYNILGIEFIGDIQVPSEALYHVIKRNIKDKKLPLTLKVKLSTQNDGSDYSTITYFYGPSELSYQKTDGKLLSHLAETTGKFLWEYRDGDEVENDEQVPVKDVKEDPNTDKTTIKVEPFKKKRDL